MTNSEQYWNAVGEALEAQMLPDAVKHSAALTPAGEVEVERMGLLEIADALDCFWNAAIGAAHERQSSTAMDVASVMAEGIAAISTRLKEHTALSRPNVDEAPIPMILHCPSCGLQHIDEPDERTPDWSNPPHRSHLCHGCGCIWRPADVATEGVRTISTAGKADTWKPGDERPNVDEMREAFLNLIADAITWEEQQDEGAIYYKLEFTDDSLVPLINALGIKQQYRPNIVDGERFPGSETPADAIARVIDEEAALAALNGSGNHG